MKYPYIGKSKKTELTILFTSENKGICISISDVKHIVEWHENEFTNTTRAYLANTYGEVKSENHADFIFKLAEVNGFGVTIYNESRNHFAFVDGVLLFLVKPIYDKDKRKPITIPLPPKEPDVIDSLPEVEPKKIFTKEEIQNKEIEIVDGGICEAIKSSSAIHELERQGYKFTNLGWVSPNASKEPESKEPGPIDSLPEVEPKKIFTKEEIESKGWLASGCECIYNDESFIYLCKSPFDGNAVIQRKSNLDWDVISVSFNQLKKPLTPEEELTKEIKEMLSLTETAGKRVLLLMEKYDIKKKPE